MCCFQCCKHNVTEIRVAALEKAEKTKQKLAKQEKERKEKRELLLKIRENEKEKQKEKNKVKNVPKDKKPVTINTSKPLTTTSNSNLVKNKDNNVNDAIHENKRYQSKTSAASAFQKKILPIFPNHSRFDSFFFFFLCDYKELVVLLSAFSRHTQTVFLWIWLLCVKPINSTSNDEKTSEPQRVIAETNGLECNKENNAISTNAKPASPSKQPNPTLVSTKSEPLPAADSQKEYEMSDYERYFHLICIDLF
ncbi:hypothetical protein RFI_10775 [Reticulomyxa filosa]|uniref:Uncharacterized protein n=1 Tax=Reticulomyxa filosa TaxID=46433 RepID=X6NLX2_RETFI|nr:hypothetical protein RFI_10775 [Reticulomyxa filosa]|eukprot:ETO26362.1 hypothetical protein RFI_10775 [Reticulomyxa filosa]